MIQLRKPPRPRSIRPANMRSYPIPLAELVPVPTSTSRDTHHGPATSTLSATTKTTHKQNTKAPPHYTICSSTPSHPASQPPQTPAPICAFYNRSFDSFHHKRAVEPYIQHHHPHRTTSGLANITEYEYEDHLSWTTFAASFADTAAAVSVAPSDVQPMPMTVPNFKVRISDEWGRRINSIESPGSDFFEDYDAMGVAEWSANRLEEAFGMMETAGDEDEGDDAQEKKCCAKCNHNCLGNGNLKLQFSSSFE